MNPLIFSNKRYFKLLFLILLSIDFYGLIPFEFLTNKLIQIIIYLPLFLISYSQKKTEYHKNIFYLFIFLFFNYFSSYHYNNQSIIASFTSSIFIYHFTLFFLIFKLHPSIYEIEKVIKNISFVGLILYFIQYIFISFPFITSLTGWRSTSDNNVDLLRFGISGEVIIILCFLMIINNIKNTRSIKSYVFAFGVIVMIILHGYRSIIFGFLGACLYLGIKKFKIKYISKALALILVIFIILFITIRLDFLKDSLDFMTSKNTQFNDENNSRIITFYYFYNDYLHNIFEWIFGGGFLGNSEYGRHLNYIQEVGSIRYGKVNWVDLGFIGLSFIGGLLFTIQWIKLLLLNLRDVDSRYYYIGAFSIYLILSTLTLNIALTASSIAIQCLAFYMFYIIKNNKK